MLTICLSRIGKKKQPEYRLVVKQKEKDPWGDVTEIVGHYNPRTNPNTITLKKERIEYWLSVGAQPSKTVTNILINEGVLKNAKKQKVVKLSQKRLAKIENKKKEIQSTEAAGASLPPSEEEKPEQEQKKDESSSEQEPENK